MGTATDMEQSLRGDIQIDKDKEIAVIDTPKDRARKALLKAAEIDPTKTQAELARYLNMSPSSVNKIIVNSDSHPMTISFAKGLSEFIGVSLDEIFGQESVYSIVNENDAVSEYSEASQDVYENSVKALTEYVKLFDITIRRKRLHDLAELIADQVEKTACSPDDYQRAIMKTMAQEAMKGRAE